MYRTIDTAIWDDPKVKGLPPLGKLLFLYLITNRHAHVSGIYYISRHIISDESTLPEKQVDTLLDTLSKSGLIAWDRVSGGVVWVKKMLDRQGRGVKNAQSAARQLANLHNSPLIKDFLEFYAHRKIPYQPPLLIGYTRGEQEQEQEQEQEIPLKPPRGQAAKFDIPESLRCESFEAVFSEWLKYRRENGWKIGPTGLRNTLKRLAAWGPTRATEALRYAMAQEWRGIFEEKTMTMNESPPLFR